MSYNFLDKSGLTYFWGKIKARFDSFSRNDLAILQSKEYSGIYGSANDQAGASFYFGGIRPTNFYDTFRIRLRVYASVPNQNNYRQFSDITLYGNQTEFSYKIENKMYSTSYRSYYYCNVCRLRLAGYTAGYSHILGIGIRGATNPTSSSYPRSFTIQVLETENCSFTFYDTMKKISQISEYETTTKYVGITEYDCGNIGLRESGDDNDIQTLRIENASVIAGTNGIKQYALCALDSNGKYQSFTTGSGTGTTKAINSTAKFRNPMIIFRNSSGTNFANGAEVGTGYNSYYAGNFDSRYTCNGYNNFALNTPVYLECTKDSDGYFSVTSNLLLQTGFTEGKYYVYIGHTQRGTKYSVDLQPEHPVYYYDGSKLVSEVELKADKSSIPTKVSDLTNDSGFTTNTGTVTSVAVKMNNTTKGTVTTSGTIDLGTVITAHQDISGKQDKLTAGTNITIDANNVISASGGGSEDYVIEFPESWLDIVDEYEQAGSYLPFNVAVLASTYTGIENDYPHYIVNSDLYNAIDQILQRGLTEVKLNLANTATYMDTCVESTMVELDNGFLNIIFEDNARILDAAKGGKVSIDGPRTRNEHSCYRIRCEYSRLDEVEEMCYNYLEYSSNKVTSISSSSTNTQYPSALAVYNYVNSAGGGITIDDVYPVGSIYMSVNNTNPSTLFGGTWEQLKDRFLLGAGDTYTAGNTGGEATHQLTKAELPSYDLYNASHSHTITSTSGYNGKQGNNPAINGGNNQGSGSISVSATIKVSSGGSNTPHNNMPPYLVVYMWKRTA